MLALLTLRTRPRRTVLLLLAITLLGLGLRLAWVAEQDYFPLGGDGRWYLVMGANLAEGRGYVMSWDHDGHEVRGDGEPTAFWPPVYPLLLAGAFKIGGISMTTAKMLEAVLGALAIPLVFLLGRALFDERTGLLGAGLYAVLPEPVLSSPLVYSEVPFTLFMLAALIVLVSASSRRTLPAIAFGILAGLAVLTRGQGLVLVPLAVAVWFVRDGARAAGRQIPLASLGLVLVIAPWTVRNAVQLDAFVPFATSAGANLRIGHSPGADGQYIYPDAIEPTDGWNTLFLAMQPDQEVHRNNGYTRRAIDYALGNPGREVELAGLKLGWLFRVDPDNLITQLETLGAAPIEPEALRDALPPLLAVSHYTLLALTALSVPFWCRRRDAASVLIGGLVVLWALFHVAFFGLPRYHLPLLPVLVLPAASLLWRLVEAAAAPMRLWAAARA